VFTKVVDEGSHYPFSLEPTKLPYCSSLSALGYSIGEIIPFPCGFVKSAGGSALHQRFNSYDMLGLREEALEGDERYFLLLNPGSGKLEASLVLFE